MKKEQLAQAIGGLDPDMVAEALEEQPARAVLGRRGRRLTLRRAAALVLAAALALGSGVIGALAFSRETVVEVPVPIRKVLENADPDMGLTAGDIVIDHIYQGAFTRAGADEMLVLCRLGGLPHAGGLGSAAAVLLDAGTLELVCYREFLADEVAVGRVETAAGLSRVVVTATTTYQGLSTQEAGLFSLEGGQWTQLALDVPAEIGREHFLAIQGDRLLITATPLLEDPEDLESVLAWDPAAETYAAPQPDE